MKKHIFGMLLMLEGAFMLLATLVALYCHFKLGEDDWMALAATTLLTFSVGGFLKNLFPKKSERAQMMTRGDSLVIVALTWVVFSFFGALPYILYHRLVLNPVNAWFETMSGFTTFGVTVIQDLESMPHGILLWRSLTQWMGGLGILAFSMALFSSGEMRNSNMFMAEASAISMDRLRPKIGATARRLLIIYLLLTTACTFFYWIGPMNAFDALNHGLTTISTGGFSTHNTGLGHFHSAYIEYAAVVFMLLSATNFTTYYYISVRQFSVLKKSEELHWCLLLFLGFTAFFVVLLTFGDFPADMEVPATFSERLRAGVFHVATTLSTCSNTGEYSHYALWGAPFWAATIVMKLIGGCTYSTSGGLKVGRMIIFARTIINEFRLHLHPHAMVGVRVSGHILPDNLVHRAMSFMMMYLFMTLAGILIFTIMGYDLPTSTDIIVSSLSDVGPNLDLSTMPGTAKLILSFYMLAGRLEIFTLLFLFMPKAWKR